MTALAPVSTTAPPQEQRRGGGRAPNADPAVMRAGFGTALLFVGPYLVLFCTFVLAPIVYGLWISLHTWDFLLPGKPFVGLQNYVDLLTQSDTFWIAVRNTLWMVIIMVPLRTLFALFAAWSISRIKSGAHFYRTLFFVPAIVPVVGAALAFIVMLNPEGPVNSMLARIGIAGPGWFSDPNWAKPSLLIMALWAAGDTIVIFSAAMLDVPKELYEAADLDGVSSRQRFWHVTMPFLSPVMVFAIVTGMIYTFQYFTEAFVASGSASSIQSSSDLLGYPGQSLLFYSTELYQQGFVYFKTGYASAMAWILFVVIFVSTIGFLRLSKRWVYAAGDN